MKSIHVPQLNLHGKSFEVTVPSSKSVANRALILAALSKGRFTLRGNFEAEDIQLMIQALQQFGIPIEIAHIGGFDVLVFDNDLSWRDRSDEVGLFLGNSGTCVRFLTTLACLRNGNTILNGKPRMTERPIGDLVDALRILGAEIEYLGNRFCPPLLVKGKGRLRGGKCELNYYQSSQFITSLLLCGVSFDAGVEVLLAGDMPSKSYLDLTISELLKRGIRCQHGYEGYTPFYGIQVWADELKGFDEIIEGDASAAVYWWAMGFFHGADFNVENVLKNSMQGDAKFVDLLKTLSIPPAKEFSFNMENMPDASLMLMAMAPLLDSPVYITGVGSLRVKETNRLSAMTTELRKIGAKVDLGEDWIRVYPIDLKRYDFSHLIQIQTYDDHRIAMSFAVLGTRLGNLKILDPDCVQKTYPRFWEDLKKLY